MSPNTIVLISGSNRGIGKGLVEKYLSRPNTTVVAGVRSLASGEALNSLPAGAGSKIILVKIDSLSETDAQTAVSNLQSHHGIDRLDIVIANAGIAKHVGLGVETPINEIKDHFMVNAVGPLILFQAAWPLLQRSETPKFLLISTVSASITKMESLPIPTTAYGSSKAAANFIVRKLQFENPSLVAIPMHPGWVQSDMGNAGAEMMGLKEAPVTIQQSVNGMVDQLDAANREMSGKFLSWDGTEIGW
ncbi:hypothetical protein MMC07_003883 [Pseudocyphellaria aurata]|nr:hypothetical protein [Pseudocyphellaria aurata]